MSEGFDALDDGSVTWVITHQVRPDRRDDFEDWIAGITDEVARFPGREGVTVLRPGGESSTEYVVIVRFASYDDLRRWEESARSELSGSLGSTPCSRQPRPIAQRPAWRPGSSWRASAPSCRRRNGRWRCSSSLPSTRCCSSFFRSWERSSTFRTWVSRSRSAPSSW